MPEGGTGARDGYRVGDALGTPVSGEEAGWAGLWCSQGPGLWRPGPKSGLEVARGGKNPTR